MHTRLLTALAILGTGVAFAAPVPTKVAATGTNKTRQALDKKLTLKSEGKSIKEVLDILREECSIEFVLDAGPLAQLGIDTTSPLCKFDVKDGTVADVLKASLAPFNLKSGTIEGGVIVSTEDGVIQKQLRQRVSFDAKGEPLGELLTTWANKTGANLVADPRQKDLERAGVTLKLDDVPLETAVRLAAEVAGYGVVRMNSVLFVTSEERASKLRPDADKPTQPSAPTPVFQIEPFPVPGGGGAAPGGVPIAPPQVDPAPPKVGR